MRTFEQIKKMLEEKGLLLSATQTGDPYDIDGFRTMKVQGDFQHLLEVVRDEFWEDSISFMTVSKLPREIYLKIIGRYQSGLPFQLLVVNDIDEAEVAVEEFLAE